MMREESIGAETEGLAGTAPEDLSERPNGELVAGLMMLTTSPDVEACTDGYCARPGARAPEGRENPAS